MTHHDTSTSYLVSLLGAHQGLLTLPVWGNFGSNLGSFDSNLGSSPYEGQLHL